VLHHNHLYEFIVVNGQIATSAYYKDNIKVRQPKLHELFH